MRIRDIKNIHVSGCFDVYDLDALEFVKKGFDESKWVVQLVKHLIDNNGYWIRVSRRLPLWEILAGIAVVPAPGHDFRERSRVIVLVERNINQGTASFL